LKGKSHIQKSNDDRALVRAWLEQEFRPRFTEWYIKTDRDTLSSSGYTIKAYTEQYLGNMTDVFQAFNREKLDVLRASFAPAADFMARMFGAMGDKVKFEQWTKRAILYQRVESAWSEKARKRIATYERWVADPKSYACWATRESFEASDSVKQEKVKQTK
jgi:hypothetical protein